MGLLPEEALANSDCGDFLIGGLADSFGVISPMTAVEEKFFAQSI